MPGNRVRVAVPSPLYTAFEYRVPEGMNPAALSPGKRVWVPFGRSRRVGVVLGPAHFCAVPVEKLKSVESVLDEHPVLPPASMALLEWAAAYYHHPVGQVVQGTLPGLLRRGRPASVPNTRWWSLTPAGSDVDPASLGRAPKQAMVLRRLRDHPEGMPESALSLLPRPWRPALTALMKKGWIGPSAQPAVVRPDTTARLPCLESGQQAAVDAVVRSADGFAAFLLEGVTGSGKTEVYMALIERLAGSKGQALVLVPEIGLTPQMVARFRDALGPSLAVLHSGLSDRERLGAWLMARDGEARVVIGTRSAAFVPLASPVLIVVDEEHDLSYKQQEGFRYSARDVAVYRARQTGIPVVLGSATPSLESLHNVAQGRYRTLLLPTRISGAELPGVEIVDVRSRVFEDSLSQRLCDSIKQCLERGEQALLFLNRRGFAPVLICHACGWVSECRRCDARLVYYRGARVLRCHHCAAVRPVPRRCPECSSGELRFLGTGTERVARALAGRFPDARVARLDRDSIARKGRLQEVLGDVDAGRTDILVGTQMVAKGHHFPRVTLVGVLDADAGLYGADFRAGERMAQLIVQVAGRAGRGADRGRVLIQTHHPDHPMFHHLVSHGYRSFADTALAERREAGLPPITCMALLRAEGPGEKVASEFLKEARDLARAQAAHGVVVRGPVPAPMERRAGRYRAQLLVECGDRATLQRLLDSWTPTLAALPLARRVRWSLDVDPQEMF